MIYEHILGTLFLEAVRTKRRYLYCFIFKEGSKVYFAIATEYFVVYFKTYSGLNLSQRQVRTINGKIHLMEF